MVNLHKAAVFSNILLEGIRCRFSVLNLSLKPSLKLKLICALVQNHTLESRLRFGLNYSLKLRSKRNLKSPNVSLNPRSVPLKWRRTV